MGEVITCNDCGQVFTDQEDYINHLITNHPDSIRDYMNRKWGGVTYCPGGCKTLYKTEDLTPETKCYNIKHRNPRRVGWWAFRLAATFMAASDTDEAKR